MQHVHRPAECLSTSCWPCFIFLAKTSSSERCCISVPLLIHSVYHQLATPGSELLRRVFFCFGKSLRFVLSWAQVGWLRGGSPHRAELCWTVLFQLACDSRLSQKAEWVTLLAGRSSHRLKEHLHNITAKLVIFSGESSSSELPPSHFTNIISQCL